MMEKKYKYCSVGGYQVYNGSNVSVEWNLTLKNNKIEKVRLIGMMPSIYLEDMASELVKNVATNILVESIDTSFASDYMERAVDVIGASETRPKLTCMYPYEQRNWTYPVLMSPGAELKFKITVTPSQSLSNVRCYLYCVFVFEEV